jgi:hypothetical protein
MPQMFMICASAGGPYRNVGLATLYIVGENVISPIDRPASHIPGEAIVVTPYLELPT